VKAKTLRAVRVAGKLYDAVIAFPSFAGSGSATVLQCDALCAPFGLVRCQIPAGVGRARRGFGYAGFGSEFG
jgi:hypothetical protein